MDEKKKYPTLKAAWEMKCQENMGEIQMAPEQFDEIIQEAEGYKVSTRWNKKER